MKFNAKYQLGKGLAFLGLATLTFAGCDKDPVEPNNPNNPQPQQKTEEFVYSTNLNFSRPGSSYEISYNDFPDTVAKLAADQSVKQIHITPRHNHIFQNVPVTGMDTRANILDNMYSQSNGKLSGENTTLVLNAEALQSTLVQSVLHNKLKIELEQYQY